LNHGDFCRWGQTPFISTGKWIPLSRKFRLLQKKRGSRRTGSPVAATFGEAAIYAGILLAATFSLAAVVADRIVGPANARLTSFSFSAAVTVMALLAVVGAVGLATRLWFVRTSAERRRALAQKATGIDLLADRLPSTRYFPCVPRDEHLVNSPGTDLKYRLPRAGTILWEFLAVGLLTLSWSAILGVGIVTATRTGLLGNWRWPLILVIFPMSAVAFWLTYRFLGTLRRATRVGPTNVEVSNQPFYPGEPYEIYLFQAGRIQLGSLQMTLVCDEEAIFREGTDIRSESRRVCELSLMDISDVDIRADASFSAQCSLELPGDVMHSFRSASNAVHWRVLVTGVPRHGDPFERTFPILVYPRRCNTGQS